MSLKRLHQAQMPVATADLAPNIPQELIIDVLLRLPAKSIGKFRCVSKPWRSLLSDPLFIKAHLTLHLRHPQKLIFFSSSPTPPSSRSISTLTFTTGDDAGSDAFLQKLNLSENILDNPSSKYASIVASCNGLVLVFGFRTDIGLRDTMYLINPSTTELVKLPASPLVREAARIGGALGYDSSNDDYKIVTVSWDELPSNDTLVDVFSLRSGSWKRINSLPYPVDLHCGVFLNGAIHWLAYSESEGVSVIAFDLTTEKFNPVPIPRGKFNPLKLVDLGGCLAMVVKQTFHQMDIWMMKEYGVGESWTEFSVTTPSYLHFNDVVCLLGDDNVVLIVKAQKFVVHNWIENTRRDLVVADIGDHLRYVMGFSESLVSPLYYCQNWRST